MNGKTLAALSAAVLLAGGGCLERKENVKVQADGAVVVTHRLRGDVQEFATEHADALPSGAPWAVRDEDTPREDGSGTDRLREATARFAGAADVPPCFGGEGDRASLRMRTALEVEPGGDAVRYTFVRTYEPRPYAWRERALRAALPDGLRKELEAHGQQAGGQPLPEDLLRRTVAALIDFERFKAEALLEQALDAHAPDRAGPGARARARAALGKAILAEWRPENLLHFLDAPPEAKAALETKFRVYALSQAALAGAAALGGDAADAEAVGAAFLAARAQLDATEDLQDESFEVRVEFPVPVSVADAPTGATIEDGGRSAVFRFKGEDLRDAPVVLRAVAEGRP